MGLSRDQRIENAGLCACQMSLQLLGKDLICEIITTRQPLTIADVCLHNACVLKYRFTR